MGITSKGKLLELIDTSKVEKLFEGWDETLIWSCLQKVMGKIFVINLDNPKSALAYVGCFGFLAGEPNEELLDFKTDRFSIWAPQNEEWAKLIEKCWPKAKRVTRYAIKKDNKFDTSLLLENILALPEEYEMKKIDGELYDQCLLNRLTEDFVASFESKEEYLQNGIGFVITKDGKIVSGASSYTIYNGGIEIEVDTVEEERRNHLALTACSALILECVKRGLYPSWDAQNMASVHLSEKLGYEFDHEYCAYEVIPE